VSVAQANAGELAPTVDGRLWRSAWRRLRRNPGALAGMAIIGAFVAIALLAPLIAPYPPRTQNLDLISAGCCPGPSASHPLGVDDLGRDVLSRIMYGARTSLLIAVCSVLLGGAVGVAVGAVASSVRWLDSLLMRLVDVMLSIPGVLMALGIAAVLGPGIESVTIAIAVVNVPLFARLLRGTILSQREQDYVLAARAVGVSGRGILWSHLLPNSISPVVVVATLALATSIIDAAGLGFLGLGPQDPSTPEWGTMLTGAVGYLQSAPFLVLFPGLAIALVVIGFNLLGDAIREELDPRLRGRLR
jgi:peptide/nickel transport system permease protein